MVKLKLITQFFYSHLMYTIILFAISYPLFTLNKYILSGIGLDLLLTVYCYLIPFSVHYFLYKKLMLKES